MVKSPVCVDASLILRTFIPASYSEQATALLAGWQAEETTLVAPALLAFEVTSALRRLVYLREITPARGEDAFQAFLRLPLRLSHRRAIIPLAWELARTPDQSRAYDAAYLALAQLQQCPFWTADERLYNAVRNQLPWVRWIGAVAP